MLRLITANRIAALLAAVGSLGIVACESPAVAPSLQTRVFQVAEADDQRLPAHHQCPAPVEGMTTGTHFMEGELTLYPQTAFTWRYTIEQYAARDGIEESWIESISMTGTYDLRGDTLNLIREGAVVRTGSIAGDVVELNELIPCRYPVAGAVLHQTELYLTESRG